MLTWWLPCCKELPDCSCHLKYRVTIGLIIALFYLRALCGIYYSICYNNEQAKMLLHVILSNQQLSFFSSLGQIFFIR